MERIRSTTDSMYHKRKAKGAQTRQLMPYALALAQRFSRIAPDPFAAHDQCAIGVCQLCRDLLSIMLVSGRLFSAAVKRKIVIIGNQMPQLYQRLYHEAYTLGVEA